MNKLLVGIATLIDDLTFLQSEKTWAIRLLSVACLSLAVKMEECRAPALSEFAVEEYNFESKVIQRMELLVLNTLEWRMNSITPFAFFHYFIAKFCNQSPPPNVVSRTVQLTMAIMRGNFSTLKFDSFHLQSPNFIRLSYLLSFFTMQR